MCILLIFNYKERKDRGLPFRSPGPVLLSAVWERSAGSLADVEPFSLSCTFRPFRSRGLQARVDEALTLWKQKGAEA